MDDRPAPDATEAATSTTSARTMPRWLRHGLSWALAVGLLALAWFDTSEPATTPGPGDDWLGLVFLVVLATAALVVGLVTLLRDWERIGPVPALSRSVVLFALLLVLLTAALSLSREWGVHIPACRVVAGVERCGGEATAREVLSMLGWNAADVVPALDIPASFTWSRPARSDDALVGACLVLVRLWVVVGVLGVLRRLWDRWSTLGRRAGDQEPTP
ncbi:hypothetical protein G7075_00370 [Phycicoccus sp. HDW14]|uniref:hypothetical protein n=1 Tax=Phycicoccus sp. HDW14 TaxID=2714941 RepID=UPI0014099BA4|nr:hypothetical protein [Phycicoccus sp. HDW14]QIM19944.1 hypothetical protein G7075_00370 [Phycicoccus sp. HDW14]